MRDDGIQLSCKKVSRYQPDKPKPEKPTVPAVKPFVAVEVKTNTNGFTHKPEEKQVPKQRHRLVITINDSGDSEKDADSLRSVVYTMKEFPGADEVSLRIPSEGKIVKLKIANLSTDYTPELRQRITRLVGEEGLKVEIIADAIS
jgi:hypothetical protein